MLEQKTMMDTLYAGILPAVAACGFVPVFYEGMDKKSPAVFPRDNSLVMDFTSEKGKLRVVFSNNRVHLLSAAPDVESDDDSVYNLDGTYLMLLDEYSLKDVHSLASEMSEHLTDTYTKKTKIVSKKNAPTTVSKAAVKSGALSFDTYTLASKLAVLFPELKDALKENVDTYGDFLCEDFIAAHANTVIQNTLHEGNPQKLKKLFTLFAEIYEDGTNEVQSLIAVSILGELCAQDSALLAKTIPYLSDTMLEPVTSVCKHLAQSRSARTRLANPPTYKPKKKKSGGLLEKLTGGMNPAGGIQPPM